MSRLDCLLTESPPADVAKQELRCRQNKVPVGHEILKRGPKHQLASSKGIVWDARPKTCNIPPLHRAGFENYLRLNERRIKALAVPRIPRRGCGNQGEFKRREDYGRCGPIFGLNGEGERALKTFTPSPPQTAAVSDFSRMAVQNLHRGNEGLPFRVGSPFSCLWRSPSSHGIAPCVPGLVAHHATAG